MKKLIKVLLSRRLLLIITLIAAIVFTAVAFELSILPLKYFIPLIVIIFLLAFLFYRLASDKNDRHPIKVALMKLLNVLLAIVLIIASLSLMKGSNFISSITGGNEEIIEMNVVVLKDSAYNSIDDLKGQPFGAHQGDAVNINKTETMIEDDIGEIVVTNYSTNNELVAALLDHEMSAIIVKAVDLESFDSIEDKFNEKIRIIQKYEIKLPKVAANSAKVTQEPFVVFISGRDKEGPINTFSLSDVNMIAAIHPQTKQVLLVSIPRDYYVLLPEFNEYDKLTHAGIYGIETSVSAIENLLDTTINYYVKVNFTSLIDIVDAIGGITIESNYDFTSKDGYHFTKGINTLNGKEALSFARERAAFAEGDRIRGQNQEIILEALINKAMSSSIITNYIELLNALDDKFVTNITNEEITDFIKKQIAEMPSSSAILAI